MSSDGNPRIDIVFSIAELAYLLAGPARDGAAAHALHLVGAIETPDYVEVGRILLESRTSSLEDPVEQSMFESMTAVVADALRSARNVVSINVPSDVDEQSFRAFAVRAAGEIVLLRLVENGWLFASVITDEELLELLESTSLACGLGVVLECGSPVLTGWAWDGASTTATKGPDAQWTTTELSGHDASVVMAEYVTATL